MEGEKAGSSYSGGGIRNEYCDELAVCIPEGRLDGERPRKRCERDLDEVLSDSVGVCREVDREGALEGARDDGVDGG